MSTGKLGILDPFPATWDLPDRHNWNQEAVT